MATYLTEHFTLEEMTTTEVRGVSNYPGVAEYGNLLRVCKEGLEPIRAHFKVPIIVTSGYRSPEVNSRIGGSKTSAHMKGLAADFILLRKSSLPMALTLHEVVQWVIRDSNIQYDQIIYEYGRWVHLGFSTKPPRKQALMISEPGKYLPYQPALGLVSKTNP